MISKKDFTEQVERLAARGRGTDIMSAIIKVCELNKLEPESAKRLLSNPLKEKLEAEASKLNLINRGQSSQANITKFFEE